MPVPSTRTRRSSPSRSVWRKLDEQRDHAGAALARGRTPQGRGGARVSHAGLGEVERQRADAGRLLSPAVARVAHPAAVHGDRHARRLRRAGVVPGRRGDGPGWGDATRDRASAVPGGRAASQEAAGAGTVDARSAGRRAQEAGPGGRAQAVPVQQTLTVIRYPSSVTENGPRITDDEATRRSNPKMRRFIFAERSGIYIIDLQKTLRQIEAAQELLRGVVLKGENVLFVCTKKQLKNS